MEETIPIACEIQKLFELKKQLDRAYYKSSPGSFDSFKKAAEICIGLQADPSIFIESQFYWFGLRKMEVYPNMLHHSRAIEAYNEFITRSYVPPENLIEVYKEYIENHVVKLKRKLENVLLDDDINISAWFRIVASAKPNPKVIDKYLIQARKETTPELIKILQEKGFDTSRIWNSQKNC